MDMTVNTTRIPAAVAALSSAALLLTAVPASAQNQTVIEVTANVSALCSTGMNAVETYSLSMGGGPNASVVNANTGGYVGRTQEWGGNFYNAIAGSAARMWCNGVNSTIHYELTPVLNTTWGGTTPPEGFTDRINMHLTGLVIGNATLIYDTANESGEKEATPGGVFLTDPNGGQILFTPGGERLIAGAYRGTIRFTLTPAA